MRLIPPLSLLLTLAVMAASADAQNRPAPFRWVNPLPANHHPRLQQAAFHSAKNHAEVGYAIYLPAGYDDPNNQSLRYPVVYWLHGGRPGSETKGVNIVRFVDRAIESGQAPPMIYVFPNGGRLSHYDHQESYGETAFLELVRHVDATYRTIADRSGRAVEGFSQGGRGAARYAFKFPELFCSAAPMGGGHQHEKRISDNGGVESPSVTIDPPWNNTWDLPRRYRAAQGPALRILIAVGDADMNFEANREWHEHLAGLGILHEFIVVPGVPHSAVQVYDKVGAQVIAFHVESFKASGALK